MKYNDHELLYLITENDEYSLITLFKKYDPLIKARLSSLKINESYYDDYYQEALMILYDCINRYDCRYKKTFNKYFDETLRRRLIDLIRKEKNYFLTIKVDKLDMIYEENKLEGLEIESIKLSEFEKHIYNLRYVRLYKIGQISNLLNCDSKKVYNAINRIKDKINQTNK